MYVCYSCGKREKQKGEYEWLIKESKGSRQDDVFKLIVFFLNLWLSKLVGAKSCNWKSDDWYVTQK